MKTIIAGTDFTNSSVNACRYAALLAQKLNCKLTIFNLFLSPVLHSNSGLYGISYASVKKTSEGNCLDLIEDLSKEFPGLKMQAFATGGAFDEELKTFLSRHQVEAVVMGLETKTKITKFIWGSHGINIAGKIDAPVIIVPEKYKDHRLETLLLAVDNVEKLHASSLQSIAKFVKTSGAYVKPLHIRTPDEVMDGMQNVSLKLNGKKVEIESRKSASIESGIKKYCADNEIDMVSIISRKHSVFYNLFNESVTKRVGFAAKVPVMAIHE